MLWLSAILMLGFGGLTSGCATRRFIQMKPTVIYISARVACCSSASARNKALLQMAVRADLSGTRRAGWLKLSRNWACSSSRWPLLNEVMRRNLSFDTWLTASRCGACRSLSLPLRRSPTCRCCCATVSIPSTRPMRSRRPRSNERPDPLDPRPPKSLCQRHRGAESRRSRHPARGDFRAARAQWRRQDDAHQHRLRNGQPDRRRSAGRRQELAALLSRSAHPHRPRPARADDGRVRAVAQHRQLQPRIVRAPRPTAPRSSKSFATCRCGTSARPSSRNCRAA